MTCHILVTSDGVLRQSRFVWNEATQDGHMEKDLWDGDVKTAINGSTGLLITVDYHS